MLFGKHKMTPKLSPKKSVEGAVGGVVGAAILTIIYGFIFKGHMGADNAYIFMMAGICAAGALLSMVGDLAASAINGILISKIMETDSGTWRHHGSI